MTEKSRPSATAPPAAPRGRGPFVLPRPIPPLRSNYDRTLGDPGSFPYTRGLYRETYRKRLWTMRQYAGFSSAAESNRRYRYLLEQGTTGLSVAFDLPTQIGYDSDACAGARRGRPGRRRHRHRRTTCGGCSTPSRSTR